MAFIQASDQNNECFNKIGVVWHRHEDMFHFQPATYTPHYGQCHYHLLCSVRTYLSSLMSVPSHLQLHSPLYSHFCSPHPRTPNSCAWTRRATVSCLVQTQRCRHLHTTRVGVAAVGRGANGAACRGPDGYRTSISRELRDAASAASAPAADAGVAAVTVIERTVRISRTAAAAARAGVAVHNAAVRVD